MAGVTVRQQQMQGENQHRTWNRHKSNLTSHNIYAIVSSGETTGERGVIYPVPDPGIFLEELRKGMENLGLEQGVTAIPALSDYTVSTH
jgi:hypothetical protein